MRPPIRLAVRAVLLHEARLLLVNAYPGRGDLWCAPGGGAEPHASLPDNLAREVHEETGLRIEVGLPCLVNEFHDPDGDFHQVDVYFRCRLSGSPELVDWTDPEGVVQRRRWVTRDEIGGLRVKPDSLAHVAWGGSEPHYDPLEPIVR
ncbi:NUDIX domain-containing protein [Histidinibacterium aquaticum]|uniref:NUDIX domain-containing protein n=1 Tax=Histidinibacterium aquaticum TaxID=2613962 RepID=A0A5J5GS15_9RHOB|nr:NUDIX domain-containing protein [Histidinibacterium aquaticum]KAA9010378.1 NUDIX domain-containing protein [Histidinibacterium aquaticum]